MQDLNKEYKRLLESKEFNKKGFLCSAFIMCDYKELKNSVWQFDFFDSKENRITSYLMEKEIKNADKLEVFKEESAAIEELNLSEVKISITKSLEIANKTLEKTKETPTKTIIILQNISKPLWNVSFVTTSFNLVNTKINAVDGSILDHNSSSLLSFKK